MFPGFLGFGGKLPGEEFMNSYYPFILALAVGVFFGIRHYFRGPQWPITVDLKDKVIIITGANSGIGLEMAKAFSEQGARVYMGCRSKVRGEEAMEEIRGGKLGKRETTGGVSHSLHFLPLDLSSLHSVHSFAQAFLKRETRLDILVNNAGVLAPLEPQTTPDGVDLHFQVNYLGHFLLTHLLLDTLKATPLSRVINNTGHAHKLVSLRFEGLVDQSFLVPQNILQSHSAPVLSKKPLLLKGGLDRAIIEEEEEEEEENATAAAAAAGDAGKEEDDDSLSKNKTVAKNSNEVVSKNSGQSEEGSEEDRANVMNRHYAYSKLSLLMFTIKMSKLLSQGPPTMLVANPGVVFTDLYRHMTFRGSLLTRLCTSPFMWFFSKTPSDGAQTALFCATAPDLQLKSGCYFVDCAEKSVSDSVKDERMIDALYVVSRRVCHKWLQ